MWGYADLPSPPKGHPKYPRMQIENRCYRSRVFRKLHIELAHRQDGLQVSTFYVTTSFQQPGLKGLEVCFVDGLVSIVFQSACSVCPCFTLTVCCKDCMLEHSLEQSSLSKQCGSMAPCQVFFNNVMHQWLDERLASCITQLYHCWFDVSGCLTLVQLSVYSVSAC